MAGHNRYMIRLTNKIGDMYPNVAGVHNGSVTALAGLNHPGLNLGQNSRKDAFVRFERIGGHTVGILRGGDYSDLSVKGAFRTKVTSTPRTTSAP